MTEQPRDWDKELADIDRAIDKQGPAPGQAGTSALPPGTVAPPPARAPAPAEPGIARRAVAKTWFYVALAVLLAAALPLWPYGTVCGLQLFFYLGAAALAFLAGVAGAVSSWRTHRGLAHLLALVVVGWAGIMAAREVLPRVGYAAETRMWLCPTVPEPAPPGPSQPAPGRTDPTAPAQRQAPPPTSDPAPSGQTQPAPAAP